MAMLILAIDTAAAACTTCLWQDGDVLDDITVRQSRGHGEILVPQIQQLLTRAKRGFESLDRVAVTRGPGSFTGLRVGLSVARATGLGLNIPVHGVGTLDCLAHAARKSDSTRAYLAALQTKRGDLYTQLFTTDGPQPPAIRDAAQTYELAVSHKACVIGDGGALLEAMLDTTDDLLISPPEVPPGWAVAELAAGQREPVAPIPQYLRDAEAKRPAQGGRLRP